MPDFKVRLATKDDIDDIINLLIVMHNENGLFVYDESKTRDVVTNIITNKAGVIGIIGDAGSIEGMICLTIDQLWYGKEWFLNELFNFVHPDFRRSTRVKSLIAFAKKCSDDMNLPLVIGIVANHRTEAKIKLYERQFDKAGAFFMYNREYAGVEHHG